MLEALCNGKIIPWERKNIPTLKSKELYDKLEEERLYFTKKMSPADCKRYEELYGLFMEATYNEEMDSYSQGFTVGSLIMMEIMEKKELIISD